MRAPDAALGELATLAMILMTGAAGDTPRPGTRPPHRGDDEIAGCDPRHAMPHLDEAKAALVDRIERRMSVAVIAPAGAGKTCLLRAVRHQLPEA